MVPYELALRNFMCYRDDLPPLRLDGLHIACLSGENGAGKSALLDAITWALWGKARMSDDELIAQGENEMMVDLTFQLDGQAYRIIRQRRRAKSGSRSAGKSILEFQVQGDMGWRPIGNGKISETEKQIEDLLHMKYDTFINASFLLQGRADEFTRKTPGERKQVLADILDLREYTTLEERAKRRTKKLHDEIKVLDGVVSQLQQEADKLPLFAQLVQEAEARTTATATALAQTEAAQREAETQVSALEAKQERRNQVSAALGKLRGEQHDQEQKATDLRAKIAADEAVLQRQAEIAAGVQELTAARAELTRLDRLIPRYTALQEQLSQLREQYAEVKRQLQSERDTHQREQQRLAKNAARHPTIAQALAAKEQRLEALVPLATELQTLRERQTALDTRISRSNALLRQRGEYVSAIEKRQDSLVAVREEQKRTIKLLQQQCKDVPRWQADLTAAQQEQQALATHETQLETLRRTAETTAEQVSDLRALCTQYHQQAEQIKRRKALLTDTATTTCPLCGSELGDDGVGNIVTHYDEEITTLRASYRTGKRDADALERDMAGVREQIQAAEATIGQAQQHVARIDLLQQQLAQAAAAQADLTQAEERLADAEQQLAAANYAPEAQTALETVEAELAALTAVPHTRDRKDGGQWNDALDTLSEDRKALQQQQTTIEQQLHARSGLEAEIAAHRRELEELAQDAAALPTVEQRVTTLTQQIDNDDYGHDIRAAGEEAKAEVAALGYTPELRETTYNQIEHLTHWADEERRLIEAQSRIDSNRTALQWAEDALTRRREEIQQLDREDTTLEQDLRALPAARLHVRDTTQQTETCRREHNAASHTLHEQQISYTRAEQAATDLAAKQTERQKRIERQGVFQELTEAFGKKGVQAMLIETAIPEIEREANRLLGRMTDNQMHLTFEMQKGTKKGDTVETLDIKIADALGTRTYDAFSGGEAMRVNFAVRVALSRLLARRAGASLETLVIDEGFGTLDAQGRERFVEAITGVQQDFKRILVITHIEELKERFPAQIEITKTAEGSVWTLA